jgi:TfoX/Sxy family transcriptional regulator of competence genes
MFGGVGFFVDGLMFGLTGRSDTLFFKTDEWNVGEYKALGGEPFTHSRGEKKSSMDYHSVSAEILDDTEELTAWAEQGQRGCPSCCGLKG